MNTPTLRRGEQGTGDLFQDVDQPFNLAGQTGIDHGARQLESERAELESALAGAAQEQAQVQLFPRKKHSHRCRRCNIAVYCYKTKCTKPARGEICAHCQWKEKQ